MSQVKQCQPRSLWPSRSSHSWSLFSVATSWLLLLSTQLPAPVSLIDVAVQTASPCEVSQDSSTQTSDQPGPSLSLDVAVQTIFRSVCSSSLDAAVQTLSHSSLSQDVSTQFGSRTVSSFSVDASMQTSTHSVVQLEAATQLNLTEFLIGWIFSDSPLTQETNGTAPSGSMSSPQLPHSLISSQVPAGPTRNVTGEVMPTSLAEAVTQLSFLEFLQRCNLLIASPQPPQLPVPISLLDAAAQTTPPSDASQEVSTQTSDQPVSSLSFNVAVQTPFHSVHISSLDAAVQTLPHRCVLVQPPRSLLTRLSRHLYAVLYHTILPHNYRSRSFFFWMYLL